jgi:hypothetical protein
VILNAVVDSKQFYTNVRGAGYAPRTPMESNVRVDAPQFAKLIGTPV